MVTRMLGQTQVDNEWLTNGAKDSPGQFGLGPVTFSFLHSQKFSSQFASYTLLTQVTFSSGTEAGEEMLRL